MFVASLAIALALAPAEKPAARPAKAVPIRGAVLARAAQLKFKLPPPPTTPTPPATRTGGDRGGIGTAPLLAAIPPVGVGDESVLKAVKLETTNDALLNFFRRRTPPAPEKEKVVALARKLNSNTPGERDEAQGELIGIGYAAVPVLRQVANNVDDVEGSARARACLAAIEGPTAPQLVVHAARLLAARKPAGAAEVLFGYLPFADDDNSFQEVESALVSVGLLGGKPDPALLKALKDKVALRRGTAAQVLCQAGGSAHYSRVRPLLKDARPSVRLRAALGLVGAYDAEAIPVLIDLLGELPPRMRVQAEDYLTELAGDWAVSGPRGNDLMSRRLRRDVWAAWWKQTDGAKLLEEFKSRTPSDEDREKVLGLIQKLDDASAEVREAAGEELVGFGAKAVSLLRRAVSQNHPRISPFAAKCLEGIEKDSPNPLPGAAPKLLALRKPEGTVEALLGYVPFAENETIAGQVVDVLAATGVSGGKPDEALVKALSDKVPPRRAAAAVALCKGKATDHFGAVRQLLEDKDAEVRFDTGRALVAAGEKSAVPALIALLKELPLEQVWELEDFLALVAGDKTPTEVVTADSASRAKAVGAWTAWWKTNAKDVDLAKLDLGKRELGFLVIVENFNPAKGSGRVVELDATGKLRWAVGSMNYPYDAEVLRGGNILVVEQQNQVTEFDRSGKRLSSRGYPAVFHAERLRNGDTFVACRNQLMVVNKEGVSVFSHAYHVNSILAAKRFRDGSMAYVSYTGHYVRLDRAGKQVKTIQFPWGGFGVAGAEVLPGDRVVVSVNNFNKVIEFDGTGKQAWEAAVTYPQIPFRLSNGHTLVASHSQTQITEIDRNGKVVKEMKTPDYKPYRVYRR